MCFPSMCPSTSAGAPSASVSRRSEAHSEHLLLTPALGAGVEPLVGLGIEAVLTVILLTAVFGTAIDPRGPKVGGLAIGLAVWGRHPDGRTADRRGNEPGALVRPGSRHRQLGKQLRVDRRPARRRCDRRTGLPILLPARGRPAADASRANGLKRRPRQAF